MDQFHKYSGCGNDFILIDNRKKTFFPEKREIAQLCSNACTDGIILLELSKCADFRMRIFNADGSEAEMCGNGIRCLIKFARDLGFNHTNYLIETMKECLRATLDGEDVAVTMPSPADVRWNILLSDSLTVHYLNTGVPHVVHFVENVQAYDLAAIGPSIRDHTAFAPQGTNVNIASISKSEVSIRTYERGVGETRACGTGATATAVAAVHLYQVKNPVQVRTASGDILTIDVRDDYVVMKGPAKRIDIS